MEMFIISLKVLVILIVLFTVINFTKNKVMELVFLLGCGMILKVILHSEVDQNIASISLGVAMLGIGLEASMGALIKSGKTAVILAAFQLTAGALLFQFGSEWKALGVAVLFQSTPLVVQITSRTSKEVRGALLGLMAIQDVMSGLFAAVAGTGELGSIVTILVGYMIVAAAIYLVAGKTYQVLGKETLLEFIYEKKVDRTEHSMPLALVLIVMIAVGTLGLLFGLGFPSSLFLLGFLLPTDSESSQSRSHFANEIGKVSELGKGLFFLLLGMEMEIILSINTAIMALTTLSAIVAVSAIATFLIVRKERSVVFRAFLASGEFGPILLTALGIANPGVVLGIVAAMLLSSVGGKKE